MSGRNCERGEEEGASCCQQLPRYRPECHKVDRGDHGGIAFIHYHKVDRGNHDGIAFISDIIMQCTH